MKFFWITRNTFNIGDHVSYSTYFIENSFWHITSLHLFITNIQYIHSYPPRISYNRYKLFSIYTSITSKPADFLSLFIIATDETRDRYPKGTVISLGSRKELDNVARNLFEVLRSFDATDVDLILSEAFEENDIGVAIMNRLKKSAGFDVIEV